MSDRTLCPLPDEQIIDLYFARDEHAISETDRKYGTLLLQIGRGFLPDERDCEECRNDTYLRLWNSIPPTRPQSLRAYAAQVLRRLAINRYHEKHTQGRVPTEYTTSLDELSEVLCDPHAPEREIEAVELRRLINSYLASLSARERYVFVGRFYMAKNLAELAQELRVHVSTVHRDIDRLRRRLREYLERNGLNI